MIKSDLSEAKEIFFGKYCDLKKLQYCDDWLKYEIPYSVVCEWAKEFVNYSFNELFQMIDKNKMNNGMDRLNHVHSICNYARRILYIIGTFKFDYYEKIITLYEKLNYDEYLLYSESCQFDEYGSIQIVPFLLRDSESKYYLSEYGRWYDDYPFNTNERFFGILPNLFNNQRKDLVDRLLSVIYDLIGNFGNCCEVLIKDLYNYSEHINNSIDKGLYDSVQNWKNNCYLNIQFFDDFAGRMLLYEKEKFIDAHFDKEKEIDWIRENFSIINLRKSDVSFSNKIINSILDYYNIERSTLKDWSENIERYFYEKMLNFDKNYYINTSLFDMKKHTENYVKYYTKANSPRSFYWKALLYSISKPNQSNEEIAIINHCLRILLYDSNNEICFDCWSVSYKKDVMNKVLSEDLNSGYLVKYYNEKNEELYNLYKTFTIGLLKNNGDDEFAKRVYSFGYKHFDSDLTENAKKYISNKSWWLY